MINVKMIWIIYGHFENVFRPISMALKCYLQITLNKHKKVIKIVVSLGYQLLILHIEAGLKAKGVEDTVGFGHYPNHADLLRVIIAQLAQIAIWKFLISFNYFTLQNSALPWKFHPTFYYLIGIIPIFGGGARGELKDLPHPYKLCLKETTAPSVPTITSHLRCRYIG